MSKYKIPMGIEKPTPDNDIVAWLLSFSRDPETGKIEQWAKEIIEELDSYTEILPSGNTIAIFVKGMRFFPRGRRSLYRGSGHKRLPYMSVYDRDCDIPITGHHLKGTPKKIKERQMPQSNCIINTSIIRNLTMNTTNLTRTSRNQTGFKKLNARSDSFKALRDRDLQRC